MAPIMGVGAFIMAEMLGVPYRTIALSAIIPALAYYLSVFLLVTFLAKKKDIVASGADAQIVVKDAILPRLYLLIPAIVLVYFMVTGASLMRSGMMGIITALVINVVSKFISAGKNFVAWKELGRTCLGGLKQAAEIAIPTAACGIIIGIVVQSGLATKVSKFIAQVGSTHLIVALLIAMLGCMLLGMALPTVAAYLVSNVLFRYYGTDHAACVFGIVYGRRYSGGRFAENRLDGIFVCARCIFGAVYICVRSGNIADGNGFSNYQGNGRPIYRNLFSCRCSGKLFDSTAQ